MPLRMKILKLNVVELNFLNLKVYQFNIAVVYANHLIGTFLFF